MNEMLNKVFNEDCLIGMQRIPDKSIDMILCDLPYGTTSCKWDSVIPFDKLWGQYNRIIKDNGAIVLTASQPFTSALIMSNPKMFKCEWIWRKNRGSNFATVKYVPMKEHESVVVFGKNKVNYYPIKESRADGGASRSKYNINASNTGRRDAYNGIKGTDSGIIGDLRVPSSVQKFNTEVGLHPTQKPVSLFEYLIKTYTNEGETVLDNCMGSGTTAIAAMQTGRNYIGFEMDAEYFDVIQKRIDEWQKKQLQG